MTRLPVVTVKIEERPRSFVVTVHVDSMNGKQSYVGRGKFVIDALDVALANIRHAAGPRKGRPSRSAKVAQVLCNYGVSGKPD